MIQLTPADIAAAADRIAGHIRHTPVLRVEPDALGLLYPVTLKLEHTQVTGHSVIVPGVVQCSPGLCGAP